MCGNNDKPFIATSYNVLFAPYFCDWLFYIFMLMNLLHTCLFIKGFCTFFFSDNEKNRVTLPHISQQKHEFLLKTKEKWKPQKKSPTIKFLWYYCKQRLCHRSTKSLLDGDTKTFWQEIELRVDVNTFRTSCHMYTINKKSE